MLRKCTAEDISDEECEKAIDPFYDNYDSYLEEYVVPNVGDTILAEFLNNKVIKEDGDYLVKLKEFDSWLFIHIYVKKDGYLVAPLNNNNSKSILPKFYTKKEFTESATQPHKAIRVSKNI